MNDFSELIERLNEWVKRDAHNGYSKTSAMIDEAAQALQSLTSTVAGLEVELGRMREFVEDAADEWSEYVVEDRAPRGLTKHMLTAWDAAISRARG